MISFQYSMERLKKTVNLLLPEQLIISYNIIQLSNITKRILKSGQRIYLRSKKDRVNLNGNLK